jgi:AmmeMemoRadiSam system protein A
MQSTMKPDLQTTDHLLHVARLAIEAHLDGRKYPLPTLPAPWDEARPVFVTLRSASGALRGCIGHLAASRASLAEEIALDAVLAATKDPRFSPVSTDELPELSVSISILGPAEPIPDSSLLDPRIYGVIVSSGQDRGVLLPDIDGIDTVEQQMRIARRKANIEDHASVSLARFKVIHVPPRDSE